MASKPAPKNCWECEHKSLTAEPEDLDVCGHPDGTFEETPRDGRLDTCPLALSTGLSKDEKEYTCIKLYNSKKSELKLPLVSGTSVVWENRLYVALLHGPVQYWFVSHNDDPVGKFLSISEVDKMIEDETIRFATSMEILTNHERLLEKFSSRITIPKSGKHVMRDGKMFIAVRYNKDHIVLIDDSIEEMHEDAFDNDLQTGVIRVATSDEVLNYEIFRRNLGA